MNVTSARTFAVWWLRIVAAMPPLVSPSLLQACANEPAAATQLVAPQARSQDAAVVLTPAGVAGEQDTTEPDASTSLDAGRTADSGVRGRSSLVLHALWSRVPLADDTFDDAPPEVDCSWGATMAETLSEEPVFSVDTGLCNYLTVRQETLREVAAGELLKVRLWHFELGAPEPAEAHAAVIVDGLELLDERVAIPGPGGLLTAQLRVTRSIPAGATALFHLHNHGANSWSLVELSAGP